jgi:hypothetical protein
MAERLSDEHPREGESLRRPLKLSESMAVLIWVRD